MSGRMRCQYHWQISICSPDEGGADYLHAEELVSMALFAEDTSVRGRCPSFCIGRVALKNVRTDSPLRERATPALT